MPISFWFIAFILTSEKYRQPVLDRIHSYVLPEASIESDDLFNVPGLLADPLLQACFQETLRMRTQNGSMRLVNEATTIPVLGREYSIRKGSIVFIPAPLIHMDTEIYSDPEEYDPERFLGSNLETTIIANDPDHLDEDKTQVKSTPKFFKKGVPVKHYMIPFGGGDNLVLSGIAG
jgi:cytochrome P450